MNPVLSSPWQSSAPLGCSKDYARHHPYLKDLSKNCSTSNPQQMENKVEQQIFQEDSLFRNLNRNTLILTFPSISVKQIDTTLAICNNNLSEAINILKLKDAMAKNNLKNDQVPSSSEVHTQQPVLKPNKEVTYIATKYKDVQIVELNNGTSSNNVKILKVPNVTHIIPLKNNAKFVPVMPRILPKILPTPQQAQQDLRPIFSPPHVSFTQPSVKYSVENNRDRDRPLQKSLSPNQILERALTFYPSCSQDN